MLKDGLLGTDLKAFVAAIMILLLLIGLLIVIR